MQTCPCCENFGLAEAYILCNCPLDSYAIFRPQNVPQLETVENNKPISKIVVPLAMFWDPEYY